jgi:hypothetical protein
MSVLMVINLAHPMPWLMGYWCGAAMHLVFDILINGDHALRRPFLFYFFTYRVAQQFAASKLLDAVVPPEAGEEPIREFFSIRPVAGRITERYSEYRNRSASSV